MTSTALAAATFSPPPMHARDEAYGNDEGLQDGWRQQQQWPDLTHIESESVSGEESAQEFYSILRGCW